MQLHLVRETHAIACLGRTGYYRIRGVYSSTAISVGALQPRASADDLQNVDMINKRGAAILAKWLRSWGSFDFYSFSGIAGHCSAARYM